MKLISANLQNIRLLTPSLLALCLFSAQNASAYECKLDDDTTGGALSFNNEVIACGKNAIAQGAFSTALGSNSDSLGYASIALGRAADSEGDNSTAVGRAANSAGESSTAIGRVASSLGESSTALGHAANSAGNFSTALGSSTSSVGDYSIVSGHQASSTGWASVAVGYGTASAGNTSIALGNHSSSVGVGSIALGNYATSAESSSIALGNNATSAGSYSTVLGFAASSEGHKSIVMGYQAETSNIAHNGIAIGGDDNDDEVGARALAAGAIALGADVTNDIPHSMKIAVPLRIQADAGTAQLLVEEASLTTAKRYLLEMKNNGATGFQLTDTSNSKSWQFAQTGTGGFTASQIGSGGPEFTVTNEGRVRMGPGSITNFDLQASGDLVIANGSVTANGILLTSSRASKTDIESINVSKIMQGLKKMEISEWRYKKANNDDRHMSPMAEEFYALFNFGRDGKHINPNDLASVALVAAKNLQIKTTSLEVESNMFKTETALLKAENMELKQRLASLEKLVTNLASAENNLSKSGSKIVLK